MFDLKPELLFKEDVSLEKKYWLRISKICNNRCRFCLDTDVQDNTFIDTQAIKQTIQSLSTQHYNRLIISGGEASIHPDFIEIIQFAKNHGFTKIQTVTNGRMFSNKNFLLKCAVAGLNEITFSIHGHNDSLHDYLTGVKGAFKQAVKGIKNALDLNLIVNADTVLNKKNIVHLEAILAFLNGLGIKEVDLLYIVPFGRTYSENFEELVFDLEIYKQELFRAFTFAKKENITLWGNRIPPSILKGYEHFIPSPNKLYDEIQGRLDYFNSMIGQDVRLACKGKRCPYCYINHFCDVLQRLLSNLYFPSENITLYLTDKEKADDFFSSAAYTKWHKYIHKIVVPDSNSLIEYIVQKVLNKKDALNQIPFTEWIISKNLNQALVKTVIQSNPNAIFSFKQAELLEEYQPSTFIHKIILTKHNVDWLLKNRQRQDLIDVKNTVFQLPLLNDLSKISKDTIDIRKLIQFFPDNPYENIPTCLAQNGFFDRHLCIEDSIINRSDHFNMLEFVRSYIAHDYFVKVLDCQGCPHTTTCRGIHINHLRIYGFAYFHKGV